MRRRQLTPQVVSSKLAQMLSDSTLIYLYLIAINHDAPLLEQACIQYVARRGDAFTESQTVKEFQEEMELSRDRKKIQMWNELAEKVNEYCELHRAELSFVRRRFQGHERYQQPEYYPPMECSLTNSIFYTDYLFRKEY